MSNRWQQELPPRDWGEYGWCYLAHGATGAISGAGLGVAIVGAILVSPVYLAAAFAALTSLLVFWRQTTEFIRRNDTPGRDMGDHIVGWCVGLLAACLTTAILWITLGS